MIDRRTFLATAAASALVPAMTRAAVPQALVAGELSQQIAPTDYAATKLWSYGDSFPGEVLRLPQGARLTRRLENRLPRATTVHWHGIRIDNAMDGVPGLTQPPIEAGESFDYDFALPDAGTYWYHSHAQSVEQIERGLYGALLIEESEPPDVDADHLLVLDDMRLGEDAQITQDFDNRHDGSHAGRLGNVILTNGQMEFSTDVIQGSRLRLRLINAANARIFDLQLTGFESWIVALDGMPLESPQPIDGTLSLAPAQRIDLICDVTAEPGDEAHLVHVHRDETYSQAAFVVTGQQARRGSPPAPLPPNPLTSIPDPAGVPSIELRMQGGAMGGMSSAVLNGNETGMRDLAAANRFWALNGVVGRTATPLADLSLGEPLRVQMHNDTAFPHAMHLHGTHFRELRTDGSLGPWRDTLLVHRGSPREIVFVADNPGDWLFHCHMLSHHATGMGTWIRVSA